MPIYDYTCPDCGTGVEKFRKLSERTDPVECTCGSSMEQKVTATAGFKISGAGVASPGYSHNGKGLAYKRDVPVGPMAPGSKAYQKSKDEENSKYYGPGQGGWQSQDTKRREEHNRTKNKHGIK